MRRVVVFGLGLSGKAAARFLLQQGVMVYALDRKGDELVHSDTEVRALLEKGMLLVKEESLPWSEIEEWILSPGIPFQHPLCMRARSYGIPVTGEIELACRHLTQSRVVGITGTNGKTTVSQLVYHILSLSSHSVALAGNVGLPAISLLQEKQPEIVVLELSSYQLEALRSSVLDIAVLLNISPDHLDRYPSFDAYAEAKCSIGTFLKEKGSFYVEEQCAQRYATFLVRQEKKTFGSPSSSMAYCKEGKIHVNERLAYIIPLRYRRSVVNHDIMNLIAACCVCDELGIPQNIVEEGMESFQKPPHRVEFVRQLDGVDYYDDSKGTNIDAVICAVQSLSRPLVLIAGGVDKGASYLPWIEGFQGKVRKVYAIGEAAEKIQCELAPSLEVIRVADLSQAVQQAREAAKPGFAVLLSPGCSSFDMYQSYAHRGDAFQEIVHQLEGKES